jgi:hypothetical protein
MSDIKTTRVNWAIRADAECPHCSMDTDFMNIDEWWAYCDIGENKEFKDPLQIVCEHCGMQFNVVGSDY